MAKIEISGEVAFRGEPVKYSDKFTKAEIVIKDVTSKYPEFIKFEAINDIVDMLLGMRVGMQQPPRAFLVVRNIQRRMARLAILQALSLQRFTRTNQPRLR